MRTRVVVALTLLIALVFAAPAAAQIADDRISLSAAVGPSFGNVGTTFSTMAGLDVKLNDRWHRVLHVGYGDE